jgi:hypothetical protein
LFLSVDWVGGTGGEIVAPVGVHGEGAGVERQGFKCGCVFIEVFFDQDFAGWHSLRYFGHDLFPLREAGKSDGLDDDDLMLGREREKGCDEVTRGAGVVAKHSGDEADVDARLVEVVQGT